MERPIKLAIVILLLLSVIAIFASPAVDLQPTALRAMKCATLLFAVLLFAGTVLCARLRVLQSHASLRAERRSVLAPTPDLMMLNCALLC